MRHPAKIKTTTRIASLKAGSALVVTKRPYAAIKSYLFAPASRRLIRGPQPIIGIVLRGTLLVNITLMLLLCHSYFVVGNEYVAQRFLVAFACFIYIAIANVLFEKSRHAVAAWMIIVLYAVIAHTILVLWGINAPVGILMIGFVLILAGLMLGSRYILPVTATCIALLTSIQLLHTLGMIEPDKTALVTEPSFGDVGTYATIFAVFALISWLSGRRMEQALKKALHAEAALKKEKAQLAVRLEEETLSLRESQMAEMRQLYRFAELGQLGTVIMHELANHLSVLTLDMNAIQRERRRRSEAITRAQESIEYLEGIVDQVRKQLKDSSDYVLFDGPTIIMETISTLQSKAAKKEVVIEYLRPDPRAGFPIIGDPLRLSQILTILITNAIDAYDDLFDGKRSSHHRIEVASTIQKNAIVISIRDYGIGIPVATRERLFTPIQSSKQHGMGIGLYIAKEMIQTHFKGSIDLDPRLDCTLFVISIPQGKAR